MTIYSAGIKKCREAAGLSQRELAVKIGVTQQAINNYEAGNSMPDSGRLPLIADALGVGIDDLRER